MKNLFYIPDEYEAHILDNENWRIYSTNSRRIWNVDCLTSAVFVYLLGNPSTKNDILESFKGLGEKEVEVRIEALLKNGIIKNFNSGERGQAERERWEKMGWHQAYRYTRISWDYPFNDYSSNGQSLDKKQMMDYEKIQNDTKRYIEPKSDKFINLPNFNESLHIVSEPSFEDLDILEKAKAVSAVVAFPRGKYPSKTNGADHLSRTSPSGGARHPSELYLIVIEGEFSGVYQISIGTEDLRKISEAPTMGELQKNIPGAFRLPVTPKLIFIVSSDFERNMYRYREPRTFRTLFYDAGHLGGLVESLMDTGNTISHGHQGFNDSYLQKIISSENLASESPIYIISAGCRTAESKEIQIGKSFISK